MLRITRHQTGARRSYKDKITHKTMLAKKNLAIHLRDFPGDKIVIFLDKSFRSKLIDKIIEISKGRKNLAELLNLRKLDTFNRWKKGEINRGKAWVTPQGIPLDKLFTISDLLISKGFSEYSINEIERHVTAYKTRGKSLWIKNPKLPIEIQPKLFRIIAHLIGDGSAEENNTNYYKNTCRELINELNTDLKEVFGDIETTAKCEILIFPIAIRHILSKFFNIQFGTFTARLPKIVFELHDENAAYIIQGFTDDEGCVHSHRICMYSFNKRLLEDFNKLLKIKFPYIAKHTTKVRSRKKKSGEEYWFEIHSKGLRNYNNQIGFTHPEKREYLEFFIKLQNKVQNHRNIGETKQLILKSLSNSHKTVRELSQEILISPGLTNAHLRGNGGKSLLGLESYGLVESKDKAKYATPIWRLTEKGILAFNTNQRLDFSNLSCNT